MSTLKNLSRFDSAQDVDDMADTEDLASLPNGG